MMGWKMYILSNMGMLGKVGRFTLPETNIFAPENGWLEYDCFLLGFGLFSGAMLVSGSVCSPEGTWYR